MNVFAEFERPDGGKSLSSLLWEFRAHATFGARNCSFVPRCAHRTRRGYIPARRSDSSLSPAHMRIHTVDRALTLSRFFSALAAGALLEVFCVSTAAAVIPAARIGWQRPRPGASSGPEAEVIDILLPGGRTSKPHSGTAEWVFWRGASSGRGGASRASDAGYWNLQADCAGPLSPHQEKDKDFQEDFRDLKK